MKNLIGIASGVILLGLCVLLLHGDGVVQVQSGSTTVGGSINGDGTGVTNAWVKEIIFGGMEAVVLVAGSDNFSPVTAVRSAATNPSTNVVTSLPSTGYLSNFNVMFSSILGSGTNFTYVLQTNTIGTTLPAPVDSLLKCNLLGNGSLFTNDSTHSVACSPQLVGCVRVNISSASGSSAQAYHWSVEWWHQSP